MFSFNLSFPFECDYAEYEPGYLLDYYHAHEGPVTRIPTAYTMAVASNCWTNYLLHYLRFWQQQQKYCHKINVKDLKDPVKSFCQKHLSDSLLTPSRRSCIVSIAYELLWNYHNQQLWKVFWLLNRKPPAIISENYQDVLELINYKCKAFLDWKLHCVLENEPLYR